MKLLTAFQCKSRGRRGGCRQCCAHRATRQPAVAVPGQSRGSARLFPAGAGEVHVVLSGRLAVGFGSEDARCRNRPRLQSRRGAGSRGYGRSGEGPRHHPHTGRRGAHGAVGPHGVKDRGGVGTRCGISRFPSPGPAFPVSRDGRKITAGQRNSPKGIRSPPPPPRARAHLPALSATRARRRRGHVSIATPSSRHDPGIPTRPVLRTADTSMPVVSGLAQPCPRRVGRLEPHLFSLFF